MIVQLTLLIALLATIASAKFNRLPFPELQVQFHPRSHPELCLAAFSTAPRQWTLKLERCNGQYESYWRWQQDEATNTWVLNAILPSANCMTANGNSTPPDNGDPVHVSECVSAVNEWQNFEYRDLYRWYGSSWLTVGVSPLKCVDVKDGNFADGNVQLWDCVKGSANQDWVMEWVKPVEYDPDYESE